MRAASERRGGEEGNEEVEVGEGGETDEEEAGPLDTPAVAAQHRRAESRVRIGLGEEILSSSCKSISVIGFN